MSKKEKLYLVHTKYIHGTYIIDFIAWNTCYIVRSILEVIDPIIQNIPW